MCALWLVSFLVLCSHARTLAAAARQFELSFTFRNKQGTPLEAVVVQKDPGSVGGQPFEIENLDHCHAMILDHSEAVQVDNVTNSRCGLSSPSFPPYLLPGTAGSGL